MGKKILVFGAHPDDCEIGMGGTIHKMSNDGCEIVIVDLTQGEMSSNGDIFSRQRESENSRKILGVKLRVNLNLEDRNIVKNKRSVELVANVIRQTRPDFVFYPNSIDSHPDHVVASDLIQEAIFHSKLKRFASEYKPFHVKHSFKYHINDITSSDFFVDISDDFAKKIEALEAYESQFMARTESESTRLNAGFLEYIESVNKSSGYRCGVIYAEGFIKVEPITLKTFNAWEAMFDD